MAIANVYDDVGAHSGRAPRKKIEMTRRNAALCLSLVVLLIGLAAARDHRSEQQPRRIFMRVRRVNWKVRGR